MLCVEIFHNKNCCFWQEAHKAGSDSAKLKAFLDVCVHFQPVFRHFFLENFTVPAEWYERRLAYTRSVATNSMGWFLLHHL